MAEAVQAWWARRQWSKDADVPYPVGTYREAWAAYPALIRQYHPELNAGITLTQVPPAADVLLLWECDAGHRFVATPTEQRLRPGPQRRKSAWCPECTAAANPRRTYALPMQVQVPIGGAPRQLQKATLRARKPKPKLALCDKTPELPAGTPFTSECAPAPASAVEGQVRQDIFGALMLTAGLNAVRTSRPFFQHYEVWPDFVFDELRIAIEYDTIGRHGLEHVGRREDSDRRKDRALRAVGWEVIRIRTGKLEPLGPHDIQVPAWSKKALARLVDEMRAVRGPLLVDAYLR